MIVDALGNPLALSLTGGQVHDIKQAEALLALVEPDALLGDKGYDADSFIDHLIARAIKALIPPKSNRKVKRDCDFALYRERNLVERFFCIICAIPDDHIDPRRSAFFMARSILRDIRRGVRAC